MDETNVGSPRAVESSRQFVLGLGYTKETANCNFWELLWPWIEHMLLEGAPQIQETATQLAKRLRNSAPRQRGMPVFSQLRFRVVS
jgi:hypothetical protein